MTAWMQSLNCEVICSGIANMAGRRSGRSCKPVKYSKYSIEDDESDKDDEDDFMDPTPPTKKKKVKKGPNTTHTDADAQKPTERKARNRLTDEEKYEQQLQEALKMSLVESNPKNEAAKTAKSAETLPDSATSTKTKPKPETLVSTLQTSMIASETSVATSSPAAVEFITKVPKLESSPSKPSQKSTTSESDVQTSCVVEADVFDSPNTKLLNNIKKRNGNIEIRKKPPTNEAALCKDDEICVAILKDNKETGRRRSERSKKIKEEEDYEMSSDSESEDDLSEDNNESDFSDYEESPKKKGKKVVPKNKKIEPKNENIQPSLPAKKMETTRPSVQVSIPKTLPKALPTKKPMKPLVQKTSVAPTLPKTPKACTNLLPRRSPAMLSKPGKFIQPGWTPPGPAGSKSALLKSPQSPNYIRVGLSRNAKLTPLHSKFSNKP